MRLPDEAETRQQKGVEATKNMTNAESRATNLTNGGYWGDWRRLNLRRKRREWLKYVADVCSNVMATFPSGRGGEGGCQGVRRASDGPGVSKWNIH